MRKEFEYRGYKFCITVELNTKAERRIGGKKWHTVTINSMIGGYDYHRKEEIEDSNLLLDISFMEQDARVDVEELYQKKYSPLQLKLIEAGFYECSNI